MTEATQYLTGLGISVLISLAVVIYLRPHLRAILVELCGTVERAAFWVAFTNIAVCLFPLVFAIYRWPEFQEPGPIIRELGTQVGAALIGLLTAVITLGIVLSIFISGREKRTVTLPRQIAMWWLYDLEAKEANHGARHRRSDCAKNIAELVGGPCGRAAAGARAV